MKTKQQIIIGAIIALFTVFLISCQTSQELKEGTYTSSNASDNLSIKLYNGDQYTVYRDGEIVVEGVYVIKNNRLYITDKKGPYACPENPNATYRWVINDKDVTLIAVTDECSGRKNALTSQTFKME
jgi:predicted secreted protein